MRKSLTIYIGLLILLIVSGVTAVFLIPDKGDESSNISDLQKEKLPDNQRDTVVTNVVNESGIGELPMPVFREDVIVYFKEMPDIGTFASKYQGRVIFIKPDIKMAVFETNPTGRTGQVSQRTLDFINETSKDSSVEKAYKDGFMFTRPDKMYLSQAEIIYPEDNDKEGIKYAPNKVIVGFWRQPSSLEELASENGGNLTSVDDVLQFAAFKTDNLTGFIRNISTNPYVRYAHPDPMGHIASYTPNDTK
jgi:hypothetical protein